MNRQRRRHGDPSVQPGLRGKLCSYERNAVRFVTISGHDRT